MVVDCHHIACVCGERIKISIWDIFQNWVKSHLNSIGNGAKFRLFRTKKNPSRETPKGILSQTVKTQMKCCISSGSALFVKVKKIFRQKNTIILENYYPDTPKYVQWTISSLNQKKESIIPKG